jgi:hypothetical protein
VKAEAYIANAGLADETAGVELVPENDEERSILWRLYQARKVTCVFESEEHTAETIKAVQVDTT